MYVLEYTEDSLLAKVVSYLDLGPKLGGDFRKGWVYAKCLHENAWEAQKPNDDD